MHYVDVQGARVPALGLGTWQLRGERCRAVVEAALRLGYRHIDTAEAYGNEAPIGAALRQSGIARDELWVTSKIWPEHLSRDALPRAAHDSVKRLGVDRLDLLLIHWPNPSVPLPESLGALRKLQQEDLTVHIGVSNFTTSMVREALGIAPILCNQVELHPYLGQSAMLRFARANNLLLTAYCPLARGRVARDTVLAEIGRAHGKSPAQVALRWLVDHDNVAAIPKAASAEHLRANLQIFDFELQPAERQRIDALARGERLRAASA